MSPPEALIAVYSDGGSASEAHDPSMPALAGHVRHSFAEIKVLDLQPDQLAAADASVEQEQQNRGIAAICQVSARRGLQESAEVLD